MISIIVPAYNEAKRLHETIEETVDTLESRHLDYEVIIVDDGSKDGTSEKALSLAEQYPTVRVFGYKQNRGKGYALKYGFQFVQGDPVLFLDADSELPPSQISRFLECMSAGSVDVVIGSKKHPLSQVDVTFSRRFLSKGYNFLVRLLFNLDIADTQVGLKLFRAKVLRQVFHKLVVQRYAYDVELLANIHRLGYRIVEMPVEIRYGLTSNITIIHIWRMFLDTIATFYRMKVLHSYDRR